MENGLALDRVQGSEEGGVHGQIIGAACAYPPVMGTDARTERRTLALAAVVGVAAGALSGLFGVGGGILIVPGLVLLLGMGQRQAHATSLAAIVPIAVSGAAGYALERAVDWPVAGLLTLGSAAGAVAGTQALRRVPERGLRVIFAGFLVLAAAALPFEVSAGGGSGPIELGAGILLVLVGMLAGTIAGLLGVGGGIVMVPGLILVGSLSQAVAKGTSLLVIIPTAVVGTIRNVRLGHVDLRVALVAGGSGMASSFVASLLSVRLDPSLSSVLFGLLLVAVAVRLLLSARGRPLPGDR
jgi:uncharacterized membrane protein YfcA